MKTKRLLATILTVVMLFSMFSVVAFAADEETTVPEETEQLKYTFTLTGKPKKTTYYDYETFDPKGIKIKVVNNETGKTVETVTYGSSKARRFSFSPKLTETLEFGTTEVSITLDGQFVATVPIEVEHIYEENTPLGSTKHGSKCAACGHVDEKTIKKHKFEKDTWIPNEDGSFVRDQTESRFCIDCGYEEKRDVEGTAGYDIEFEEYQFLHDIMIYIDLLLDLIFGSIKR